MTSFLVGQVGTLTCWLFCKDRGMWNLECAPYRSSAAIWDDTTASTIFPSEHNFVVIASVGMSYRSRPSRPQIYSFPNFCSSIPLLNQMHVVVQSSYCQRSWNDVLLFLFVINHLFIVQSVSKFLYLRRIRMLYSGVFLKCLSSLSHELIYFHQGVSLLLCIR